MPTTSRTSCFAALLITALMAIATPLHAADPFAGSRGTGLVVAQDDFLPVEQAYRLEAAFLGGELVLHWAIADGYYLYRHQFGFRDGDGNTLAAQLPGGEAKEDEYFGRVEVYYREVEAVLTALPAAAFDLAVTSQGCADAGLCYPPRTDHFRIDPAARTVQPGSPPAASATAPPVQPATATGAGSWLSMLLLAALGGALLNLMPCVFPVLSLKVLGFARSGSQRHTLHGLSYSAGVVLSFVLVAALLLALRAAGQAVGWGFQLQQPWFVGALAYLFFVLGLSLSGFWELGGRWMGAGGGLAALSVFATLGAGMALPVLLLCLYPRLLQRLPKPGPWMERLKQALAFPLYGTAIWLCWIVGRQSGPSGMAVILGGALALTLTLWLWRFGPFAKGVAAASAALALALLGNPLLGTAGAASATVTATGKAWQPYDAATLDNLRAAGRPVFLNITADWCITCLANERVALSSRAVREAFEQAGITYLKGDWTHYDAGITALLAEFGRSGIPLYVYYPGPGQAPVVLPQLLTPSLVVETVTAQPNS